MPTRFDADDVLQEIYLAAYRGYPSLRDSAAAKAWLLGIARNKCVDFYRTQANRREIPVEEVPEPRFLYGSAGKTAVNPVRDTVRRLSPKEREVLSLYYFEELPQAEIARRLNIPLGTVKSRLHSAKQNFRKHYPPSHTAKGAYMMKKLPELLPKYTIEAIDAPPFSLRWEELVGWFIIPQKGETLSFGEYDIPSRACTAVTSLKVTGKAKVHGIEGVEITASQQTIQGETTGTVESFIAQLTDTHCRYLASFWNDHGMKTYTTFLDEGFLEDWGCGEGNIGNEVHLSQKGLIRREGDRVTCAPGTSPVDIVGRYTVTIDQKSYATVCVMDIRDHGIALEQFLDKNGRTILWRRFNRDDWAFSRYKEPWSTRLPENQRLLINGETYVHWYDCITDYILG